MMQSKFKKIFITGLIALILLLAFLYFKKARENTLMLERDVFLLNTIIPKVSNRYNERSHWLYFQMAKMVQGTKDEVILNGIKECVLLADSIQATCELVISNKNDVKTCQILLTEIEKDRQKIVGSLYRTMDGKRVYFTLDSITFETKLTENSFLIESAIHQSLAIFNAAVFDYLGTIASEFGSASLPVNAALDPNDLPIGKLAYNPSKSMQLDKRERVWVKISQQLAEDMGYSSNAGIISDSIKVSPIMSVKLSGEGFEIIPLDDPEQGVTMDGYTQWDFDVIPKESGNHNLYLKVAAVYEVPGLGSTKKYLPVYDRVVEVKTEPLKVIGNFIIFNWEFFLSTFLIPLGAWKYSDYRRAKRRRNKIIIP